MAAFFRMGKGLNGADGTGGKFWKGPSAQNGGPPDRRSLTLRGVRSLPGRPSGPDA